MGSCGYFGSYFLVMLFSAGAVLRVVFLAVVSAGGIFWRWCFLLVLFW